MSQEQQPIYILNNQIDSTQGKSAQRSNIAAAKAVAEAVRSTLGPSGSDKMLVSGEGKSVIITNDGATILREIDCQHPAGNLMISVAENQEEAAYDGTTSAVIIAGALLAESELLIAKGIHPTTICKGFREASKEALANLKEQVKHISATIDKTDIDSMLSPVAKTSLTGKSAEGEVDLIAELAIEAVSKAASETSVNLDDIKVMTFAGASFSESELLEGCLIEKDPAHTQMPKAIAGPILCLTSEIEVKEMKQDAQLTITAADVDTILKQEEDALKGMVEQIKESGAAVVLCKGAIDDLARHYLSRARILAVERVISSDLELVRKTTGANLVNSLKDLKPEDLGEGSARVVQYGEHHCVHVSSEKEGPVSAVLRGVSSHTAEELERAFEDCIGVVSVAYEDGEYLAGGGASYAYLARALKGYADTIGGREQMAIDSFAQALESIPRTLAENAGVDPVNAMIELRKQVSDTPKDAVKGVAINGAIEDMVSRGVLEPSRVVSNAIKSSTEAAISILRIDDVLSMSVSTPAMPGGF